MDANALQLAEERALSIANRSLLIVLALLALFVYELFFSKRTKLSRSPKNISKAKRNKKIDNKEVGEIILCVGAFVSAVFFLIQIIPIYYDCANDNYVVLENCTYTYYNHHRTVTIEKDGRKYEAKTGKRVSEKFIPTGEHNAHIIFLKNSKLLVYVEQIKS